jgi:Transposase DDE domain
MGLHTFVRAGSPRGHHRSNEQPSEQRESFRWRQMVRETESSMGQTGRLVHVMDSEADAYELLQEMVGEKRRFIVRLKYDRAIDDERPGTHLESKLQSLQGRFVREVHLAARARTLAPKGTRNGDRARRQATLSFSATKVTLLAPKHLKNASCLTVNVVHVREVNPPPNAEPVDWKLVTTEPIESIENLESIVDFYRARWTIEEFFKALKTGCAFAKRQLETLPTLLNALAVFTPIAWELLLLRAVARHAPEADASTILRPTQLLILQRHKRTRLAPGASVRQAFLAIAQLGGHIKNNGEPGWQVLGRGYDKLLAHELGAKLALNM